MKHKECCKQNWEITREYDEQMPDSGTLVRFIEFRCPVCGSEWDCDSDELNEDLERGRLSP